MGKFTTFERRFEPAMEDVRPAIRGGRETYVRVEDNGLGGVKQWVPLCLVVADGFDTVFVSLTLDETVKLRNYLNEAIVWAEGVLAQ
jgi:hypothetical protein